MIRSPLSKFRAFGATGLAVLLAACGGGGDGPLPAPEITVNINLQNQQQVARASFGSSVASSVGGFTGATASTAASPLVISRARAAVLAMRKRIAADVSDLLCPGGGAADATGRIADPDFFTAGDYLEITFDNCNDGSGAVASGAMRLTVTAADSSRVSFGVSASNLTVTDLDTGFVARLDGGFGLTLSGDPSVSVTTRLTVSELLTQTTQADTVSLLRGYATEARYIVADATTRAVTAGPVDSAAAGGTFDLTTPQALRQTDNERYPHSGQILDAGKKGKLRATVLSNTQVRLELDTDDDGVYDDGTTTVLWADLLDTPN